MGFVDDMLLPDRETNEGEIEEQINNVMDRGMNTYLRFLLAKELAGPILGLSPMNLDFLSFSSDNDVGFEHLLGSATRSAGNVVTKSRLF